MERPFKIIGDLPSAGFGTRRTTIEIMKYIELLEKDNERLRNDLMMALDLIKAAKCPECDGSGGNAVQVGQGDWEQVQCRWCFEKNLLIGEYKSEVNE